MAKQKYDGWASKDWNELIDALNKELPPEKCGKDLTEEEREDYIRDLEFLKKERKENPDVPISYWPVEKDWG